MTSSGTYNFSVSNGEAVLAAFARVKIYRPAILQEHMLNARNELNFLLSSWSNKQVNLFKVEALSIPLVQGTATYSVPGRVVMILDAYRSLNNATANQSDNYVTPMSRTEYASLSNKFNQAPPVQYWFDRLIAPTVTFYPVPDGNGPYVFNYYACVQMQDASLPSGETPDLPYRWYDALVSGLAHRFSRIYPPAGVDALAFETKREADADKAWGIAATQDVENVPMTLAPGIGGYYRA